jgi:hypothetical protein
MRLQSGTRCRSHPSLISVAFAIGFLVNAPVVAETGKPWFGVKTPDVRELASKRYRSSYRDPAFPPLSLRLAASEDPYADIRGQDVHEYLAEIIEVTVANRPEGERFWGRIAGSAAEWATADYIAERFHQLGLADVRTEWVQGGEQWWPLDWDVTLLGDPAYGPGTEDYRLASAFPAIQLKTGALAVKGLEAELAFVGLGRPVDLVGRDLTGKVAVVHGVLQPDPFFQSARGYVDGVIEAGAVGVLTMLDAPGNHQYALEDMGPADAPCFILGGDDGRFLEDVMAAGGTSNPPSVRLSLTTEVRDSWRGKNVIGLIPGKIDEYVVIVAHLDGYFESANDNGAGLAAMIALAEHYANPDVAQPTRNLLFVGTSGHHEFSDGVEAFIAAHRDILAKTVLVFNVEHPSMVWSYYRGELKFKNLTVPGQLITTTSQATRGLTVSNGNPLLISFYRDAIDRYGLVIDSEVGRRPTGDAFGFFLAGYTVAQILDANLWYHSSGDLLDAIDPAGLERATRLYAYVLDKIDASDRVELAVKGR